MAWTMRSTYGLAILMVVAGVASILQHGGSEPVASKEATAPKKPTTWTKDGVKYFSAPLNGDSTEQDGRAEQARNAIEGRHKEFVMVRAAPLHTAVKPLRREVTEHNILPKVCDSITNAISDGWVTSDWQEIDKHCSMMPVGEVYYVLAERGGYYAINTAERRARMELQPLFAYGGSLGLPDDEKGAAEYMRTGVVPKFSW